MRGGGVLALATRGATMGAAVVAVLSLSAGCASDDSTASDPAGASTSTSTSAEPTSTSPSPTSTSPSAAPTTTRPPVVLPTCASVWVAGQNLPRAYAGCDQDGSPISAQKHPCSFGSSIIEFDNRYYASAGNVINEVPGLDTSSQFHQALSSCQA